MPSTGTDPPSDPYSAEFGTLTYELSYQPSTNGTESVTHRTVECHSVTSDDGFLYFRRRAADVPVLILNADRVIHCELADTDTLDE